MLRHNSALNHITNLGLWKLLLTNSRLEKSFSTNLGLWESLLTNSRLEKSFLTNLGLWESLLTNSGLEKSFSTNLGLWKLLLTNSGLENQFRNIINQIYNKLLFLNRVINLDKIVSDSILDKTISKDNNIEEFDKENFITIFIYKMIKIGEYLNSGLKRIGKNIGNIADIVTILSFIFGFIFNFQSNNEGGNNITYNYNISINNYNISTDSYLTNLEIGFTNKDTMLYSKSNESLEEITHLCFELRVKIIDKCSELTQIEVNKNGIILKGWVRSDDINILK